MGGDTKEFDYAKGQENVYNVYQGRDGVSLGSLWTRALFAWYFGDFKLLISDNVTSSSRILFRRLIQDRIQRIAPFLRLDHDPYLVVSDGRLIWLQDAYTSERCASLLATQPRQRHQLYTQLGENSRRCLRRQSGFLRC